MCLCLLLVAVPKVVLNVVVNVVVNVVRYILYARETTKSLSVQYLAKDGASVFRSARTLQYRRSTERAMSGATWFMLGLTAE